jgi:hypothetical protein
MKATIEEMRIVARNASVIKARCSRLFQASQQVPDDRREQHGEQQLEGDRLEGEAADGLNPPARAVMPRPNTHLSSRVSGALRSTASTMAPTAPIAPASVGVGQAHEDRAEHQEDQHRSTGTMPHSTCARSAASRAACSASGGSGGT